MISLLQRNKIDDERWNRVIAASEHETIYPYTWYMDACSVHWAGYVMQDYECIMPVAFNRKYGLKYAYQPFYCQQLGVYSEKNVDPEIVRMFLQRLCADFRVADYSFNGGNMLGEEKDMDVADRMNHLLPLGKPYEQLMRKYTENCRRNVKKSYDSILEFSDKVTVEEAVALKKRTDLTKRKAQHYMAVRTLFESLDKAGRLRIYGMRSESVLHSAAIFAFSDKRVLYLLSASGDAGKEQRAMFRIIDTFIQVHAGENRLLDFEGSSIPSIARFFGGFGAKPEVYPRISYNHLPALLKKLTGHG